MDLEAFPRSSKELLESLLQRGVIARERLESLLINASSSGKKLSKILSDAGLVSENEILQFYAKQLNVAYRDNLDYVQLSREFVKKIPFSFVRSRLIFPISIEENELLVALCDPFDTSVIDDLKLILGVFCPYSFICVPKDVLLSCIERHYVHEKSDVIQSTEKSSSPEVLDPRVDDYDLLSEEDVAPLVKLLNSILALAITQEASDIHFEPSDSCVRVRFRIDGILQERNFAGLEAQHQLIARIKVMARLDIAERRRPQDGRIKLQMAGREIDFRVSTVPVIFGERVVMRILDRGNSVVALDQLGMDPKTIRDFRKVVSLPEGIVLVTGPTGSGKSTTLYSALGEINTQEYNIMTIEDPVEFKMGSIAQIAVNRKVGLDFASGLRHILRQDPDIIMVGEIRDKETAEIAIQASLTGHMVLSTLHTNDAPSAMVRLVDMGIEPYLLSSSIVAVIAQRLLRRICPHCIEHYMPSERELHDAGLSSSATNICFAKGKGCDKCFYTGYKGRCGIFEMMLIDEDIRSALLRSCESGYLRSLAIKKGMIGLREQAQTLVVEKKTTIFELISMTRGFEGDT